MRKIILIFFILISLQLFGQRDLYTCNNLWKNALPYYENPDTLLIINNPTKHTKWKNQLLPKSGRTIVLIYKKNMIWYSAYIMLTYENEKPIWYQSVPSMFSYNLQDSLLPILFSNCSTTISDMIEYKKRNGENSGYFIFVFMKINNEIIEVEFQPKGIQDITALYGSRFSSIFTMYSLGLSNSMSLHYPIKMECEREDIRKKKKK